MIHCVYLDEDETVPADFKVPVQNPGFRPCGFITPTGGRWLSKPLNGLSSSIEWAHPFQKITPCFSGLNFP